MRISVTSAGLARANCWARSAGAIGAAAACASLARRPSWRPTCRRPRPTKPRKLTQKEERELEALPAQIEKLEAEQAELAEKLADPGFYQREPGAVRAVKLRLESIEHEVAAVFARWEELEALGARAP